MRLRIVGIAVALILSGCGTPDDVKKTGVVWRGTVAARYDQLANCLSAQTTLYYKSALQFDKREQRATVTFLISVTGIPVEVYDLRQISDNATEVSWSTRLERGSTAGKPSYLMHLCGASPLPATAPPVSPPAAARPRRHPCARSLRSGRPTGHRHTERPMRLRGLRLIPRIDDPAQAEVRVHRAYGLFMKTRLPRSH